MTKIKKLDLNKIKCSSNNEDIDICSSYLNGKCLESPNKHCDGCASEFLPNYMKQNITSQQLLELDKVTLYNFIVYKLKLFWTSNPNFEWYAENITLNKLIELLSDSQYMLRISRTNNNAWIVELNKKNGYNCYRTELIDALWETTKFILLKMEYI
jgi:hypothetical protein